MADHFVEIVTMAGGPTAVSRGVATSWQEFASRWKPMLDGVWAFLGQNDLRTDGHNIMVYRNAVPNLEFEVGVQVARSFEPAGAVVPSSLPRGRAAHTIHSHHSQRRLRRSGRGAQRHRTVVPDQRLQPQRNPLRGVRRLGRGPRQCADRRLLAAGELIPQAARENVRMISVDDYLLFLDEVLDDMVRIVTELGDELANQRPDVPDSNSPYAILTHCLC